MNAPERAAAMTELVAEYIPVTSIRPSRSAAQGFRRKRYNAEALLQLAANIQQVGVIEPILVRPIPADGTVKFEIVAGERRWLAADRAGIAHVPAIIRDLTDSESLKLQVCENIQRENTHPLEEAEAFHDIMRADKINADQLGDIIGKSRSYVYARTKLRDLCPEARDALQAGTLDASKALLLARLKSPKLQAKALKILTETNWRGESISYKEAFSKLRDKFMVNLGTAPFALDDATFFMVETRERVGIPACIACPHYSANDADLQQDLGGGAHVCTDAPCFEAKVKIHWSRKRADAEAAGKNIITRDDAKKIIPGPHDCGVRNGYINLDAPCDDIEFSEPMPKDTGNEEADDAAMAAWEVRGSEFTPPSYRQVLGDTAPASVLAQDPKTGKLVELVPVKETLKALKAKGVKPEAWRYKQQNDDAGGSSDEPEETAEERKAAAEREQLQRTIEGQYRARLFNAIFGKWKGPLKRPDLERLAEAMRIDDEWEDGAKLLAAAQGGKIDIAKLKDDELLRAIILLPAAAEASDTYGKPGALLELAQRFKIDAKKIRADVTAELKPKPAPKADAPQPKAAAKPAKKKAAKK